MRKRLGEKLKSIFQDPKVRDDLTTAKNGVMTALALAERIASNFPPAAMALGGVLEVLDGIDKTVGNVQTLNEIRDNVVLLTESVLEPFSKAGGSASDALRDRVDHLVADLKRIPDEAVRRGAQNAAKRYVNRQDDEAELLRVSQRIQGAVQRFQLNGDVTAELNAIKRTQAAEQVARNALLESLPRAKLAGCHSGRADAPDSCFEGTRSGILADIKGWATSKAPKTPPVYLVNGIAGIGKSTIAQTIALWADELGFLGASFFFSRRGDAELRDPMKLFPTLAYQLAGFDYTFARYLEEALGGRTDVSYETYQHQLDKMLVGPMQRWTERHEPVLLVLDALDECEEKGMKAVLPLLLAAVSRAPFPIRILITSRPEPHIISAFQTPLLHQTVILHNVEASVIQNDIRLYLRHQLIQIPKDLGLSKGKWKTGEWFKKKDLEALVERSGKLFVYAATASRFIADETIRNPSRQVRVLLAVDIGLVTSGTPYAALDQLYSEVIIYALATLDQVYALVRFREVVGTIILLRDPLSTEDMEIFLGVDEGYVRAALSKLGSVIITPDSDDEPPQVYHKSFPDFITDPRRCRHPCCIDVPERETALAIRCLIILKSSLKRNIAGINNATPLLNSEVPNLKARVADVVSTTLEYACFFWASHLSRATPGDAEAIKHLEDFVGLGLLYWLETLSLLGKAAIAAACARDAELWAVASGCSPKLIDILHDTYRFSLAFLPQIAAGPEFIYRSALPFSPEATTLYQAYKRYVARTVRVIQGVGKDWSPCLSTLQGHTEKVRTVAFSPDGLRLASGSDDDTARLWDTASGACTASLVGHAGWVVTVAFSPDSSRVVTGSFDRTLRMWDAASGACTAVLEGHADFVWSIAFSADGSRIASGSRDKTVRIWDGMEGSCVTTLLGHTDSVETVVFFPDGSQLVSGSDDSTIKIWDLPSSTCTMTLEGHTNAIERVALSPHVGRLASCSEDRTIRLWSTLGECTAVMEGHNMDWVREIAFSPDGARLASVHDDPVVRLWDSATGQCIANLEGHTFAVGTVAFNPDGTRLATGSRDETIRLWDVATGACVATLEGHTFMVAAVAFSTDGSLIASGSDDATIRLWEAPSEDALPILEERLPPVTTVAFSPDGEQLVLGYQDASCRVWQVSSGTCLATMAGHTQPVIAVAFSADMSIIVTGSEDATSRSWDSKSDTYTTTYKGHVGAVTTVMYSPNGAWLASGSRDETVRIWAAKGNCVAVLAGHTELIATVGFSPDSSRLVSGSKDDTARVWDIASGTCITTIQGHDNSVTAVAFSPDGRRVATASRIEHARIWDAASGVSLGALAEPTTQTTTTIIFSADDSHLKPKTEEETIRSWDPVSGVCISVFEGRLEMYPVITVTLPQNVTDSFSEIPSKKAIPDLLGGLQSRASTASGPSTIHEVSLSGSRDYCMYIKQGLREPVRLCYVPASLVHGGSLDVISSWDHGWNVAVYGHSVALGCPGGQVLLLDLSFLRS